MAKLTDAPSWPKVLDATKKMQAARTSREADQHATDRQAAIEQCQKELAEPASPSSEPEPAPVSATPSPEPAPAPASRDPQETIKVDQADYEKKHVAASAAPEPEPDPAPEPVKADKTGPTREIDRKVKIARAAASAKKKATKKPKKGGGAKKTTKSSTKSKK